MQYGPKIRIFGAIKHLHLFLDFTFFSLLNICTYSIIASLRETWLETASPPCHKSTHHHSHLHPQPLHHSQPHHHSHLQSFPPHLILLSLLTSFLAFSTLKPLLVKPFSTTAVLKGSANRNAT